MNRLAWEGGGRLVALWVTDDSDRDRGFVVRVARQPGHGIFGEHDRVAEPRDAGIAGLVGALVISNPINIIVSSIFGVSFTEYARWMIVPALASIVVSYLGATLGPPPPSPCCASRASTATSSSATRWRRPASTPSTCT